MAQYRVCPYCDAHLDPGERCDCRDKEGAAPPQPERPQVKEPIPSVPAKTGEVKARGWRWHG